YFIRSHSARLAALFATNNNVQVKPEARPKTQSHLQGRLDSSRRFSRQGGGAARQRPTRPDAIAIIGLSGRYPEAVNIDAYWHNLREGNNCIIEVPKERWDWREYFSDDRTKSGHHYSKWGGFIAGVDEFDPLFFNISPKEAKYIDPQER